MKLTRLKITLLSALGLLLLSMLSAPNLIKTYINRKSPELIGRKVVIEQFKYNYFTSTVKVYGFKLYEQNNIDEFVTFDTLIINVEPLKYLQRKIEIEQFYLKGLTSKVIMKDSIFNFNDLIAFHSTSTNSIESQTTSQNKEFKYAVSNIELRESNFYFDNKNVDKLTQIENLDLAIPFIGWDQEKKSSADIKFNFKNGGFFQSTINVNPNSGNYDAKVEISKLNLSSFYEYAKEYADINSLEGSAGAELFFEGNTYEGVKSILSGQVDVTAFGMTDNNNKTFIGAESIHVELDTIDYFNSNYKLGKLEANNTYSFFQLDSTSNNFFRIFKLDHENNSIGDKEQTNNSTPEKPVNFGIENLVVKEGVLDYTDNLTGKAFEYHLSQIAIDSKNITNTTDWLVINSTMLLNNRGNLAAQVSLNPKDYYHNIDVDISIEKFVLPDLNIYTNYYMGHSIVNGDMYYYSKSKITDGLINSKNSLLVKNAELKTVDAGLYSLPLKFAFFLLTDKNGDVTLEIPVQGNVNDPSVDVGSIVWATFKNVIGKTVASPVNFLVGLVGGDPKELEELTFAYTDTMPSEKQYRQLNKLLDLEQKKKELAITMTYFVDNNLQKEAIAKDIVGQKFNTKRRNYKNDETAFKKYVVKQVKNDSLSFNEAIFELTKAINLDSISESKDQKLIEHVNTYLKLKRPDTSISIKKGEFNAPENSGSYPKFSISYGMINN